MPSNFAIARALRRDLRTAGIGVTRVPAVEGSSLARDPVTRRLVIKVARGGPAPLADLLHESGHLRKGPAQLSKGTTPVAAARDLLRVERAANRGALGILRALGADRSQKAAYRKAAAPGFGSYRNGLATALVAAKGVPVTYPRAAIAAGRRALDRGASVRDVEKSGELARKRLLPGYREAKRAVGVQHRDELRKYFETAFLYRLQRLATKVTQLSRR